jgi:hypothetical protein
MAAAQRSCPSRPFLQGTSLQLHAVPLSQGYIHCDISRGLIRHVVPEQHPRTVFDSIHTIAHPGTRATCRLILAWFVWKGMSSDNTAWCKEFQDCNRGKVTSQPAAYVQPISIPNRSFTHIQLDLVGPLPVSSRGFPCIFTIKDRFAR